MYVPPPPMNHPMSPIIQFREASDHNKINLSLFSQIGAAKFHPSSTFWWIFVSISFNHAKALFDAFGQSGDEESCETLQLAGKSEEINPKLLQTCIFDRRKSLHPDNTQLSYAESDP